MSKNKIFNYHDKVQELLAGNQVDNEFLEVYLNKALSHNDRQVFRIALGDAIKGRNGGVSSLSKKTGISADVIYRILRSNGSPKLLTLQKLLKGLGFLMKVTKK